MCINNKCGEKKKSENRLINKKLIGALISIIILALGPLPVFGDVYHAGWIIDIYGSAIAKGVSADIIPKETPTIDSGFVASWVGVKDVSGPKHWVQIGWYKGNPNVSNCDDQSVMKAYWEYNGTITDRTCNKIQTVYVDAQHNYKLYKYSGSSGEYVWRFYFGGNYQGSGTVDFYAGDTESIIESIDSDNTLRDLHTNMKYYDGVAWYNWPARDEVCTPYFNTTKLTEWTAHYLEDSTTNTCT